MVLVQALPPFVTVTSGSLAVRKLFNSARMTKILAVDSLSNKIQCESMLPPPVANVNAEVATVVNVQSKDPSSTPCVTRVRLLVCSSGQSRTLWPNALQLKHYTWSIGVLWLASCTRVYMSPFGASLRVMDCRLGLPCPLPKPPLPLFPFSTIFSNGVVTVVTS